MCICQEEVRHYPDVGNSLLHTRLIVTRELGQCPEVIVLAPNGSTFLPLIQEKTKRKNWNIQKSVEVKTNEKQEYGNSVIHTSDNIL